jgi:hypothetical protein
VGDGGPQPLGYAGDGAGVRVERIGVGQALGRLGRNAVGHAVRDRAKASRDELQLRH